MRLSVSVDPKLLETAVQLSGAQSKREAIEQALQTFIQHYRREQAIRHAGTFPLTLTRKTLRDLRHKG